MANESNASFNGTYLKRCSEMVEKSTAWKVGNTLAYCLVLGLAISGNFILTVIIFKTKSLRKTINLFIANMSSSGLLFCIFVLPKVISEFILGHQRWLVDGLLGLTLCKLVFFFQDVSIAVSIQSLVLIAVDRFGAIVFPLRPPLFTSKTCGISIALTWITAFALHSPYIFTRRIRQVSDAGLICYVDWQEAFGPFSSFEPYFISLFVLLVVVPIIILVIIYGIIIVKLKQQTCPRHFTISRGEQQRRLRQERNILKMAAAIVVGFGLCMAPFCIYAFMFMFVWKSQVPCKYNVKTFKTIAMFFFYATCAVNPCVCFKFNVVFRKGLMDMFRCCHSKENRNRGPTGFYHKSRTTLRETRNTRQASKV